MKEIFRNIDEYYSEKITTHGITPEGVDWNGEDSQILRFNQLLKIVNKDKFVLGDLGCGYGKLFELLTQNYKHFGYYGYDLSNDMINEALQLYGDENNASFFHVDALDKIKNVDYMVASGIFNVKMNHSEAEWLSYILHTIEKMNEKAMDAFSFNILTKYSDKEFMRDNLYYADPMFLFDYCKRNFSKNVTLLHDYDLYEFTILVKKR